VSRSGLSENDGDDNWNFIRYRGQVASAIRGKRGQAFLRELRAALLTMPKKELLNGGFSRGGEVCALGSVALRRKLKAGIARETALKQLEAEFPEENNYSCAGDVAPKFGIADVLAAEIMWTNDSEYGADQSPKGRWKAMYRWVRENIVKAKSTDSSR
jgi:hypothetical protein